ncbi:Various environmental stresses-induced protein [Pannonibacter phragmitetus]|uniref:Various environmental stresses-induced protein n=1 Tax=Pannonibacter phragmitetus TaxID=121719 RepID=A0A378ZVJ3_9HYPH|nr:HutD family protein [Pannonibacter phragmitetus]SUB00879.1 Various environmental stresses-induced protein [Pannonibacter phragmitetus]
MAAQLIRWGMARAMPWKNGGGITHELAVFPEGAGLEDFGWRLSMAEVASDGPFSAFTGIDRTLALVDGAGIGLDSGAGGEAVLDTPGAFTSFDGGISVTGRLIDGQVLDFNVMTRRGAFRHSMERLTLEEGNGLECSGPGAGEIIALVCVSGRVTVALAKSGGETLQPRDCLLVTDETDAPLVFGGDGIVCLARLVPVA